MVANVQIRCASREDVPFLWLMLTFAASMGGTAEDIERAQTDPALKDYVEGFGRPGDIGVVALAEGEPVGAAWVRLAPPGQPSSEAKAWSADVPELAIATVPEMRGRGVGTKLLHSLFDAAHGQHSSIALSVRDGNNAVRLYERQGFSVQRRIVNRVGTMSLLMSRKV
jgi:ribosomal protein S18 acetylase RimI-like enzyme